MMKDHSRAFGELAELGLHILTLATLEILLLTMKDEKVPILLIDISSEDLTREEVDRLAKFAKYLKEKLLKEIGFENVDQIHFTATVVPLLFKKTKTNWQVQYFHQGQDFSESEAVSIDKLIARVEYSHNWRRQIQRGSKNGGKPELCLECNDEGKINSCPMCGFPLRSVPRLLGKEYYRFVTNVDKTSHEAAVLWNLQERGALKITVAPPFMEEYLPDSFVGIWVTKMSDREKKRIQKQLDKQKKQQTNASTGLSRMLGL